MGPLINILFDFTFTETQWQEVLDIFESVSEGVHGDEFSVISTLGIQGTIEVSPGRPLGFDTGDLSEENTEYDPEEIDSISELLGFRPRSFIGIYCMSKSATDHRILGELGLSLAEKFGGVIDLMGAIFDYSLLPEWMKKGIWLWETANWEDIEPYFEQTVNDIPGKIYSLLYETGNQRIWCHHLCEAEFLRNWLQNPAFHLIK